MECAYVVQTGATLRRSGELIQVWVERKKVSDLQVRELRQLVLAGNVLVTPAVFELLVDRGIDTVFMSHHGKFRARIVGQGSSHVALRLAQMEYLRDSGRALQTARAIVAGKLANQRAWYVRALRRHPDAQGLKKAVVAMSASRLRLAGCETLDEVRGCEGAAAAAYFRAFGELLRAPGFFFDGRNRRPPMDPVNAMLSLGYTLLINVVESAIQIVGLDPWLGALHGPQAGRPSLACDLMEEHRTPVVDALVVAAVNRGAMQVGDFEEAGPGEPVVIKREGLRKFVRLFERRMSARVLYAPTGTRLAFRQVIEQQARRFARHVTGREAYGCFEVR